MSQMTLAGKPKNGYSLIELLIAMALGVIITGAVLQSFLAIKQAFLLQQGMARMQENARIISILLGDAIINSGNAGCNAFSSEMVLTITKGINAEHYGLELSQPIKSMRMQTFKNNPLIAKSAIQKIVPNSDILWIKTIKPHVFSKNEMGKIVTISDCLQIDVFWSNTEPIPLNKYYGIFSSTLFYVGKTRRGVNALYSTDLNGRTLELVEGVECLKFNYIFKPDNTVERVKLSALLSAPFVQPKWWHYEWSTR